MNEKGLSCALLVMINGGISEDRESAMNTFALIRYLLDHVATVDEAISVVSMIGYSNGFVVGEILKTQLHVFVTDAQGNTLVIESINNKLCLTKGEDAKAVTNHCLSKESTAPPTENSLMRYNKLKADVLAIESHPEKECTLNQCRDMLESVSRKWNPDGPIVQSITRWSEVFDVNNLTVYVWTYAEFDKTPYVFSIRDMR